MEAEAEDAVSPSSYVLQESGSLSPVFSFQTHCNLELCTICYPPLGVFYIEKIIAISLILHLLFLKRSIPDLFCLWFALVFSWFCVKQDGKF